MRVKAMMTSQLLLTSSIAWKQRRHQDSYPMDLRFGRNSLLSAIPRDEETMPASRCDQCKAPSLIYLRTRFQYSRRFLSLRGLPHFTMNKKARLAVRPTNAADMKQFWVPGHVSSFQHEDVGYTDPCLSAKALFRSQWQMTWYS